MGITALAGFMKNGFISVADYPKYIIPYTPISIALIICVVLLPVFCRLFKRYTQLISSVIAVIIFLLTETGFERIKVVESEITLPLESWQYSLCVATPQTLKTIGEPIYARYNPGYKLHFYIISIIIILAVINTVYGFYKMYASGNFSKKRPLLVQTVSTVLFIGLCIYACFTAFYRNGTIKISALSAVLMTVFFIVFGITAGLCVGSLLYARRRVLSVFLPALTASLITFIMYLGELILMGGELFIYGDGFLFQPIGIIPFSIIDLIIILLSGVITYGIMHLLKLKEEKLKMNAQQ
jgi:hypothetical protein